jgi:hypothetical protein
MPEKTNLRIVIQSNYWPGQERRYRDLLGMSVVVRLPDDLPIDELRITEIARQFKTKIERQALELQNKLAEEAYGK